jgi:hypothetical protein
MTGEALDYKKHLTLKFGDYCQVHENDEPRNSMLPRTQGAICMGPTSSQEGGFRFLNLATGKKITRGNWTALPMPEAVIDRVNTLGAGQPTQLVFKDRRGREIGDVAIPGVDTEPIEPDGPAGVAIDEVLDPNDEEDDESDLEAEVAPEEADEPDLDAEVAPYADGAEEDDGPEEEEIPGVAEEIPGVPHQEDPGEIPGVADETPGV